MRNELVAWGVNAQKIIVEPDAVDIEKFSALGSATLAKQQWDLSPSNPVIGYAGQLRSMGLSKGVEVLIESLEKLQQSGVKCAAVIAGGPLSVQQELESSLSPAIRPSVRFLGVLPHQDIPSLLHACDILVYPAPASDHPFYHRDTSPLKLFEYMAVGKPIVCANLLPIRDVVDESCVRLVPPGDPHALASALHELLDNPLQADQFAQSSKKRVQQYTWVKRMQRVIASL